MKIFDYFQIYENRIVYHNTTYRLWHIRLETIINGF